MSLTIHFQSAEDWTNEFVARCNGNLSHIVGVSLGFQYPGVDTLYRTFLPDHEAHALVDRGKDGADEWIDRFADVYREYPDAIFISSNEYLLYDKDRVDRFNAFHVQYIQRMSNLGHRVACGQINTGWMRLRKYNNPPPYPESIAPTLAALWAHEGILTLHEYWPGLNDPTGNVYRYRDFRAALIAAGITNLPPFYISELGMDLETTDPDSDYGHWGWIKLTDNNWPLYFGLLKEYSREIDKDPYMLGASIFTVGGGWDTFQINYEQAMQLADFIGSESPPPPPERARGFMASKYQTTLNWDLIDREGYSYVELRISGPNSWSEYTHVEIDPWLDRHIAGADSIGLLKGGFHFITQDLAEQAKVFAQGVQRGTWELPLWCDVEAPGLTRERVDQFLYYADLRVVPMGYDPLGIYTNVWLWGKLGPWDRDLWIAQPDVDEPTIDDWIFWQWRNGPIPDGEIVSLDFYRGTEAALQEKYGTPTNGGEEPDVKIYDKDGNEKDWQWVQDTYGEVTITKPTEEQKVDAKGVFVITKLQEVEASLDLNCHVSGVDQDDKVAFYWPGAPKLEEYDPPTARWEDQALKEDIILGTSTLLMGSESDYNPATQQGAYGIWPLKPWMASEYIKGLGWLMATHYRHLDVTFELVPIDDPSPTPTGSFSIKGTVMVDLVIEAIE